MVDSYNRDGKYGLDSGVLAPEIDLIEVEGEKFNLGEIVKNKSVVVNFFRGHF